MRPKNIKTMHCNGDIQDFLKFLYFCIYLFIYFHHTTCESTCDTLSSSAANQSDNTVSVAQGGTALSYRNCDIQETFTMNKTSIVISK